MRAARRARLMTNSRSAPPCRCDIGATAKTTNNAGFTSCCITVRASSRLYYVKVRDRSARSIFHREWRGGGGADWTRVYSRVACSSEVRGGKFCENVYVYKCICMYKEKRTLFLKFAVLMRIREARVDSSRILRRCMLSYDR